MGRGECIRTSGIPYQCPPFLQGITEIPSGLLPSERAMPMGSRREGIFAEASDHLRRFENNIIVWSPGRLGG